MGEKTEPEKLGDLLRNIEGCATLDGLGAALDTFGECFPYQILHIGVGKVNDASVKDTVYTRTLRNSPIEAADFGGATKIAVLKEATHLMAPFNLITHQFQVADEAAFRELREIAATLKIDGVMALPFQLEDTILVMAIICSQEDYAKDMQSILSTAYQILAAVFRRFPMLARLPLKVTLTDREVEVLQLTAQGFSEAEIAERLKISGNTVRNHIQNCKAKLNARNKLHAVSIATRIGEIDPPMI